MTASLLAISLLWIHCYPHSVMAWSTPPTVTTINTKKLHTNHHFYIRLPLPSRSSNLDQPRAILAASNLQADVTLLDSDEDALHQLTVPELKARLRSSGQKISGTKSELIQRLLEEQQKTSSRDTIKNEVNVNGHVVDTDNNISNLDPSLNQLPEPLIKALIKNTSSDDESDSSSSSPKLLPIQQKSYQIISKGNDAVLFSPTGTGKSLAFILPLAARLLEWKHDGSLNYKKEAQKQRFIQQQRKRDRNDSFSSTQSVVDPAEPSILIVEPSRELARQVGKIWGKFHPTATKSSKRQVVTVYGGVPMARHAAMLSSKTDVVIGTPGRIRELIREKYLITSKIRSIVLDEADTLLNFKDNPEVEWLLEGMREDYQLVLASATVNKRVEKFVGEVMELEVGEEGYVTVEGSNNDITSEGMDLDAQPDLNIEPNEWDKMPELSKKHPSVRHWSMPASSASRITLTSDLVVTMVPRRGIVFVPSKAEVESVAQELSERLSANDVSIHILHGDMVQQARSRTILAFSQESAKTTRILIATDVASRGLDLPAVDLVLQYGVPRMTGKDGTFDSELYIHRTGRAGRFGNTRTADAIVLYDRTQGEATTLSKLQEEMKRLKNIDIEPRQLPTPYEVMEAAYNRVLRLCEGAGADDLVKFFADKLTQDESLKVVPSESALIHRLASAMAALSGLDGVVPARSLLTANPKDRTIRVWKEDSSKPLSPSEVTSLVKTLGSGKLGRISICDDGSAVFDLGVKRAEKLLQSAEEDASVASDEWHFEFPVSLPIM